MLKKIYISIDRRNNVMLFCRQNIVVLYFSVASILEEKDLTIKKEFLQVTDISNGQLLSRKGE